MTSTLLARKPWWPVGLFVGNPLSGELGQVCLPGISKTKFHDARDFAAAQLLRVLVTPKAIVDTSHANTDHNA
jgi:hypothetical protein